MKRHSGRVGRTNDQVLLAELDSLEQATAVAGRDWVDLLGRAGRDAEGLREALGKLRLEAMLSKTIVLTDAQALDGRVLLALAASGLLDELRTDPDLPLPLVLRTRKPGLDETLASMFDPEQGGPFRSAFLTDGRTVARLLVDSVPGPIEVGIGSVDHLVRAGADPNEVVALENAWSRIDQLITSEALQTAVWDNSEPWDHWFDLSEDYDPLAVRAAELTSKPGEREAILELGHVHNRSAFLTELEATRLRREQSATLKEWFDERYRRAIAFQHQADYRSIHGKPTRGVYDRRLESPELKGRVRQIELPEDTLSQLGHLTRTQWQTRFGQVQNELDEWWNVGDIGALNDALKVVVPEPRSRQDAHSRYSKILSFGLSLGTLYQDPNSSGVVATLLLNIGAHVVQSRLEKGRSRISVTDYFDDRHNMP